MNRNSEESLKNLHVIIFKKSRKLVKPELIAGEPSLGSLTLVTYRLKEASSRDKKIISRMLEKSLAFKVRKQVYLFPFVKRRTYEKYYGKIFGPEDLCRKIDELNGEAYIEYNLILIHPRRESALLINQIRNRVLGQLNMVIADSKVLMREMKTSFDDERISKRISELKRRLEVAINLEELLRRIYRISCRKEVETAYKIFCCCRSRYKKIKNEGAYQ